MMLCNLLKFGRSDRVVTSAYGHSITGGAGGLNQVFFSATSRAGETPLPDSVAELGGAPFGRTAPPSYGLTASSEMLFTPNFSVAPKALSETKA